MDTTTPISDEARNKIYKDVSDIIYEALRVRRISEETAQDASAYITSRLDSISDELILESFLEELADRWEIFTPLLADQEQKHDDNSIQNIQNEIQNIT